VYPRNKMTSYTHTQYLESISSLQREIETLRDRYHDINGSFISLTSLIIELTSLIDIVPTPSHSTPYRQCICLTHSQYTERFSSIDARLRNLVYLLSLESIPEPAREPAPAPPEADEETTTNAFRCEPERCYFRETKDNR
jgi:hypothetical protein